MIEPDRLESILTALGTLLGQRGLTYELVTIGGASLALRGLVFRPTQDLDVVAVVVDGQMRKVKPLPEDLLRAARDVAAEFQLSDRWLNSGPSDLMDFGLPEGFADRAEIRRFGPLTLRIAGRFDQICFKVYAAVDQAPGSRHLDDLRELKPSADELFAAGRWARSHDPSDGFLSQLRLLVKAFGVENDGRI